MANKFKKTPEGQCPICGGFGNVLRGYVEPECGAKACKELVQCPKCQGTGKTKIAPHQIKSS